MVFNQRNKHRLSTRHHFDQVGDAYRDIVIAEKWAEIARPGLRPDKNKARKDYELLYGDFQRIRFKIFDKLCEVMEGKVELMDLLAGDALCTMPLLRRGVIENLTLVDAGMSSVTSRTEKVIRQLPCRDRITTKRLVIDPAGEVFQSENRVDEKLDPGTTYTSGYGRIVGLPNISQVALLNTGLSLPGEIRGIRVGKEGQNLEKMIREKLQREGKPHSKIDICRMLYRTNPTADDDTDPRDINLGSILAALSGEGSRDLYVFDTPSAVSEPTQDKISDYVGKWVGSHDGWSAQRTEELPDSFGTRFTTLSFRP